jgi:hypothetical protein
VRKILFGALLGAAAMYFMDPERGAERRLMIEGLWRERKDTVLEAARTTASAVSTASSEVSEVVGSGLGNLRPGASAEGNGAPVGASSTKRAQS